MNEPGRLIKTAQQLVHLAPLAFLIGCAGEELLGFRERQISPEPFVQDAPLGIYRLAHVLVPGNGLVLQIRGLYDPSRLVMDDEVCWTTSIEVPEAAVRHLPLELPTPRAYLKKCNCAFNVCSEESLIEGKLLLRAVSSKGVQAEVNLKFKSLTVQNSGLFLMSTP